MFIREINAMYLPSSPVHKNGKFIESVLHTDSVNVFLGNNPYCIIEMNNNQRQTTPVLCDTSKIQWQVAFRFFVCDIHKEKIKFSIYNRSKYTTDRKKFLIEKTIDVLIDF